MKTADIRMTEGPIARQIAAFAFPVFLGNLFQQLYNTADTLIVGRFIGTDALAAVASSGNLVFLLIGLFQGLSIGSGVVIAQYIGAGDRDSVRCSVHTWAALNLLFCAGMTAGGYLAARPILVLMRTPEEVLPLAVIYFHIFILGSSGMILYNALVAVLQAAGDSRHPFIYLFISSALNVALDLFFIAGLHLGVGAAAAATVISQAVSASLCLIRLMRSRAEYRLEPKRLGIVPGMAARLLRYGVPTGFQYSLIGIANVFVQTYVNDFGKMAVSGCGVYSRIEGFVFLPINSFAAATSTFVGQNVGAGQFERAGKGVRSAGIMAVATAELIGTVIFLAAPQIIGLFDTTPEVIAFGTDRMRTSALFYFLLVFTHIMMAAMRGYGRTIVPMLTTTVCWCVVRVLALAVGSRLWGSIEVVYWVYPVTWALSSIVLIVFWKRDKLLRSGVMIPPRRTKNAG